MDNSRISSGWVFFIGGLFGVVAVLRAKMFSWKNSEFLNSEQDRREEVPMTAFRRWVLVGVCILISLYGAAQLERDHAWHSSLQKESDIPALTR